MNNKLNSSNDDNLSNNCNKNINTEKEINEKFKTKIENGNSHIANPKLNIISLNKSDESSSKRNSTISNIKIYKKN